jgi:hypothetical protein
MVRGKEGGVSAVEVGTVRLVAVQEFPDETKPARYEVWECRKRWVFWPFMAELHWHRVMHSYRRIEAESRYRRMLWDRKPEAQRMKVIAEASPRPQTRAASGELSLAGDG